MANSTILYIGQDRDEWELLKLILGKERNDKVVMSAPNLDQVQIVAEQEIPILTLLDFVATIDAGFDLFQFYEQLRAISVLQAVPVLLWRVPKPSVLYSKAQQAGIAGYIDYVCQPQHLLAARDIALAGGAYYPPLERISK